MGTCVGELSHIQSTTAIAANLVKRIILGEYQLRVKTKPNLTIWPIRRLSGKLEVILIDLFFPFKLQSLKKILRADPDWSACLLDNNKISTFCPEEDVLWSDFYLLIEPYLVEKLKKKFLKEIIIHKLA